jgi:uncharacterized protein (TIGR00255 family)
MIKSMTAFARKQTQGDWGTAIIEIKTVNHRYLDINLRTPEAVRDLEMPLREAIRKQLQRGKVDFTLRYSQSSSTDLQLTLNEALLVQLINAADKVESYLPASTQYGAMDLLRWPGVIQANEGDLTVIQKHLLSLAGETLIELNNAREREGCALTELIQQRLTALDAQVELVKPRIGEVMAQQRQKLQERISELEVSVDPERLEQELVLLAQRIDVSEELDRLITHTKEVQHVLNKGGTVGRRLDFLMQELNREANTLGSKSIDSAMTQASIEMKVLIEQMREQVQNIE